MKPIKFIRIFLLVLIIIGIGLLATQKLWVPRVVDKILKSEDNAQQSGAISDWKTYKNNDYHFVFNYPNDWKDSGRDIDNKNFFIIFPEIAVLDIDILKATGNAKEVATAEVKKNNCPGDHIVYSTDVDAQYALFCSASTEDYVYIIQSAPNVFIRLAYHDDFSTDWTESQKLIKFNQIKDTFRFIK